MVEFQVSRAMLVTLVAIYSCAHSALAAPLPDASASFVIVDGRLDSIQMNGVNIPAVGMGFSLGGLDPEVGGVMTSAFANPSTASTILSLVASVVSVPSLSTTTAAAAVNFSDADSSVSLEHSFEIVGPPHTLVPVILWDNHQISASGIGDSDPDNSQYSL